MASTTSTMAAISSGYGKFNVRRKKPNWRAFWETVGIIVVCFLVVLAFVMQANFGRPYRATGFDSRGHIYYEYTDE